MKTADARTWPPIPRTKEERQALLRLEYLIRRGLLGLLRPPDPS